MIHIILHFAPTLNLSKEEQNQCSGRYEVLGQIKNPLYQIDKGDSEISIATL